MIEEEHREELADHIIEVSSYEAPRPQQSKNKFLPWHRPRKQFVRHHQWCREVQKLIAVKAPTEGVLKYLGLPGGDLLDLRHFHSAICEQHRVNLRFLGFNNSAKPTSQHHVELNISLDEVKRLNYIDPQSDVLGDDFLLLANQRSIAFQKAKELGPYDIVNLDLCDGFGAKDPGADSNNYYNAVASLLGLQARNAHPWLLFLTTRADKPNINIAVLEKLVNIYSSNLAQHEAFRDASREHFALETKEAVEIATENPEGLLPIFLIGLSKWIITQALEHEPPTSVELCSTYGYRVDRHAEHEDLISLALKFTPTVMPVNDPHGLATQTAIRPNEGKLATKALRRVLNRIDVDKKLNESDSDLANMIDATAQLLSLARYDIDKYREWAAADQSQSTKQLSNDDTTQLSLNLSRP